MGLLATPLAATLFAGALLLPSSHGVLVNITVDDTNPDPITNNVFTYSPAGAWNQGNNCSVCFRKLDPSQTYDGTWHDTTYAASQTGLDEVQVALLQFTGSAIYVYGIETPGSSANISYYIDGQFSGATVYLTSPVDEDAYNILLYANTTIPPGAHSFELKNGGGGGITSQLLFDYIVYTRENVIPSVVALIVLIVLFLWRQRHARRVRRQKSESFTTQGAIHAFPVTRMAHGDHASPGLALAGFNDALIQSGQQHLADDASNLVYSPFDTPEVSHVPVQSKRTRMTRTSPPKYNALFPAE
ncbi:hypothetical protein EIP86_008343 [Pleurotus ostreatoroseus]|nr:hypothetical protein EIP86_008343 [Pleurotus ostreatoroseus]